MVRLNTDPIRIRIPDPDPQHRYRPLVERCAGVYGVGNILKTSVADPDPGLGAFLPLDPGSGIGFFRIQSDHWIRIRNLNTDPDPGGQK